MMSRYAKPKSNPKLGFDILKMLKGDNMTAGRPFSAEELSKQLGMNLLAVSGGRIKAYTNEDNEVIQVELPVAYGYSVRIELAWDDTYTVSRVYSRGGKTTVKGSVEGIYCDQVGEVAYQASLYISNKEFGKAVTNV